MRTGLFSPTFCYLTLEVRISRSWQHAVRQATKQSSIVHAEKPELGNPPDRRDLVRRVFDDADEAAEREGDAGATGSRRRRVQDAEAQADVLPEAEAGAVAHRRDAAHAPDDALEAGNWTRFDLGHALGQLRSLRAGAVRRALRKLRIRFYHAPSSKMKAILSAAGIDPGVVALVDDVVSTCGICRLWTRPGPRGVAAVRLCTRFNQQVQIDLLFVRQFTILHMIDACIRWSVAKVIPNRERTTLLQSMQAMWFGPLGFPEEIVSDEEGGVNTEGMARDLELRGVKLTLRAPEQHAGIVERHNELLRRQIHLMEGQTTADGLRVDFDMILSEALFAKNCLFTCGGLSPYEALYGRTPGLLNVMREETGEPYEGDHFRLRQIAIQAMVQSTAEERARRADTSKTRRSGELLELAAGDLVEFWRRSPSKDVSSWRGPATVVDITSLQDGLVGI